MNLFDQFWNNPSKMQKTLNYVNISPQCFNYDLSDEFFPLIYNLAKNYILVIGT